jgi:hypothetical protein
MDSQPVGAAMLSHISRTAVTSLPAVLFMTSMAVFVQAFVTVKLSLIALFVGAAVIRLALRKKVVIYRRLVAFYTLIGAIGVVWSIVGLQNPANYSAGAYDALRLYCFWSAAFVILFSLLRSEPSLGLIHSALVWSGILISLMNFVGLFSHYTGAGLIPDRLRAALDLQIAIGEDGYVRIMTQNIGPMFVIAPYLLALQFREDAARPNSLLTKVSLLMSLLLVAVSGRRGLWLIVAVTPFVVALLSLVTRSGGLQNRKGRLFIYAYSGIVAIVLLVVAVRPSALPASGQVYAERVAEVFSAEDERTIQKPYLIAAFLKSPIIGSGFGGSAEYVRNHEKPWIGYELTYHQMLFNLGILGSALLVSLYGVYFVFVARLLRRFKEGSAIPFALVVGVCALFGGSYSNRYLGSFDFLFWAGMLPYLSTFHRGFERPSSSLRPSTTARTRAGCHRVLRPSQSASYSTSAAVRLQSHGPLDSPRRHGEAP